MIKIEQLTKRYGQKTAIDHISFEVKKGERLGFLGRNGAGKSTTMNIVTGYLSPSEGDVTIDGWDILSHPREAKRRIGYLPEQPPLYMDMTVEEYLRFVCAIKDVNAKAVPAHLDDLCGRVKIDHVRGRLIRNLSKGYRQRVGIAQALAGSPEVVILDEPTIGLDPAQVAEIRALIIQLERDRTLVLSSHMLSEVADVCERVVIIDGGRITAVDTLARLKAGGQTRTAVRVAGQEALVSAALSALAGVTRVEPMDAAEPGAFDFLIESEPGRDIRRELFGVLAGLGAPLLMLKPMDTTLEEIFHQYTSGSGGA